MGRACFHPPTHHTLALLQIADMVRHLVDSYTKVRVSSVLVPHSAALLGACSWRARRVTALTCTRACCSAGAPAHPQPVPAVLEIPSKDRPYDPAKVRGGSSCRPSATHHELTSLCAAPINLQDSILVRVKHLLGGPGGEGM
jgi:hypothetical protein